MPELPEVELLKQHLETTLIGFKVTRVRVKKPRIVRPEPPRTLQKAIEGTTIRHIDRRGKNLLLHLDAIRESRIVLVHLGMTGRMFLLNEPDQAPPPSHLAITLEGDRGWICYTDTRGFGRWSTDLESIEKLGPEPLDSKGFHAAYFKQALARRKTRIKDLLLDQSCIAGLGNIYACEVLFAAGLHPLLPADQILPAQRTQLLRAIRTTLTQAIRLGQSTALDWTGSKAGDGFFYFGRKDVSRKGAEERFSVYDRSGKPCRKCGASIRKIKISQRSSYFCPTCQSL